MTLVHSRGLAHHADGLLVVHAEELQLLAVLRARRLLLALASLVLGLHEGLAEVPQRQVARRLLFRGSPPANGTVPENCAFPKVLQAGPAEAVAAREQDGIAEDVAAHGTRQVLFGQLGRHGHARHAVSCHVKSPSVASSPLAAMGRARLARQVLESSFELLLNAQEEQRGRSSTRDTKQEVQVS